jgi:hypothetical protein
MSFEIHYTFRPADLADSYVGDHPAEHGDHLGMVFDTVEEARAFVAEIRGDEARAERYGYFPWLAHASLWVADTDGGLR